MKTFQFLPLLTAILFSSAAPLLAATYTVTTTVDENDGSASIGNGLSLRDAVMLSNASTDFDTIVIPAGTYVLSIPENNAANGSGGSLDLATDAELISQSFETPVIDANHQFRIFQLTAAQNQIREITFVDLLLKNGFHPDQGAGIFMGPGISLTLNSVQIEACTAEAGGISQGGAIYYSATTGSLLDVIQASIVGNAADQGSVVYSAGTAEAFFNYSRFARGSASGPATTFYFAQTPPSSDFGDNWFGTNAGPAGMFTGISAPPFWLVLNLTASPESAPVPPGQITLTANARQTNDLGTSLTPLLTGIPVTWSPGTSEPRVTENALFEGLATSTITTQTRLGTSVEEVTLDQQTARVNVVYGPDAGTISNVADSLEFTGSAVALFSNISISAQGAAAQFVSATITISPNPNFPNEAVNVLSATLDSPGNAVYSGNTLTITQNSTAATYEAILRSVSYNNTSSAIIGTPRTVTLTLRNDPVTTVEETLTITFPNNPVVANDLWVLTGAN